MLVRPGLELGSPLEVAAGLLAGGRFLLVVNAVLPHRHGIPYSRSETAPHAVSDGGSRDTE